MILSVQWLKMLGPILWEFSCLSMAFTIHSSDITLQGLTPTTLSLMEGKEFRSVAETNKKGIVLQLIEGPDSLNSSIDSHPKLQALLDQFQSFF